MTAEPTSTAAASAADFGRRVLTKVEAGARFCGLFASAVPEGTRLVAIIADDGNLGGETMLVSYDDSHFPSLAPRLPAAAWYEREIHDLFGIEPVGHPRPDPLILPLAARSAPPRPGSGKPLEPVELDTEPLPAHLRGEGVFTIPYGPVRSGVFESVEYLVETPGEEIPHLRARVFYKHRGVEIRFEDLDVADGVLLAERVEGVASVAHAVAYCQAVEQVAGVDVPVAAGFVRVIHAELERVANHLDSTIRHTEAAGQAVAFARFSLHKERVQRLRARLCGSRFGRGVVLPGGVSGPPLLDPSDIFAALDQIDAGVRADIRLLMDTPSFIDRLRGTGTVPSDLARQYSALGPVGRASGQMEDVRFSRPYAAYSQLGHQTLESRRQGDALARQLIRTEEIAGALHLIRQAIDRLQQAKSQDLWQVPVGEPSGQAIGWAEAPQGEVLYLVDVEDGRLARVKPRSASFHNLALFHAAFPKDILTDFAFIEASFGLSIAGVAG